MDIVITIRGSELKFLNISDIKLKVTLSADDCREYGIDTESGDFSTQNCRQAIRSIMERAERECGFTVSGDKILVQLYPLPSGECELLVTRLVFVSRKDRAQLASSEGMSLIEQKCGTYRFSSKEDLISAVKTVRRKEVIADLYIDDLGRYYISTEEELSDGISELEIFVEYGERLSALPIAVLSEYGKLLAKSNAFDFVLSGGVGEL